MRSVSNSLKTSASRDRDSDNVSGTRRVLPGDAATAVHRHDLTGDEGRIGGEEERGFRDVLCGSATLEQRSLDDFALQFGVGDSVGGPHHRSRCDRIDAHLRRKFAGERTRQHDESGFRDTVNGVTAQGPQCVNVDDVEDEPVRETQRGGCSLREKERGLQVGAEQVVPMRLRDFTDRSGIKRGGVVHQNIEPAETFFRDGDERTEFCGIEKVRRNDGGARGAHGLEFGRECLGLTQRAIAVDHHVGAGRMERACDGGSHPSRASGDERNFARERRACAMGRRGVRIGGHGGRL